MEEIDQQPVEHETADSALAKLVFKNIEEARDRQGKSRNELGIEIAERGEANKDTYRKWKEHKSVPQTYCILKHIAESLHVSLDKLFGLIEEDDPTEELERLRQQVRDLQGKLDQEREADNQKGEELYKHYRNERRKLTRQHRKERDEIQAAHVREMEDLRTQYESNTSKLNKRVRSKHTQLEEELQHIKRENERLRAEIEQVEEQADQREDELRSEAKKEIEQIRSEHEEEIDRHRQHLAELERKRQRDSEFIDNLRESTTPNERIDSAGARLSDILWPTRDPVISRCLSSLCAAWIRNTSCEAGQISRSLSLPYDDSRPSIAYIIRQASRHIRPHRIAQSGHDPERADYRLQLRDRHRFNLLNLIEVLCGVLAYGFIAERLYAEYIQHAIAIQWAIVFATALIMPVVARRMKGWILKRGFGLEEPVRLLRIKIHTATWCVLGMALAIGSVAIYDLSILMQFMQETIHNPWVERGCLALSAAGLGSTTWDVWQLVFRHPRVRST